MPNKSPKKHSPPSKKHNIHARHIIRRICSISASSSIPEILLLSSLVLARYWLNSDFSYPSEIFIPIILLCIVGSIVFYLYKLVLKNTLASHIAALTLSYFGIFLYKFTSQDSFGKLIIKLIPNNLATDFTKSVVFIIVLAILLGIAGYAIDKLFKTKHLRAVPLQNILLFVIAFIFLTELVRVGGRVWHIRNELSYQYKMSQPAQDKSKIVAKPDVYYLLFDRYGSGSELKNNFNFDNSGLTNYLGSEGFTTRDPAYANYPFTMSSISSTMAMNYFPEFEQMFGKDGSWQTAFPYRSVINNPPIAQLFKQNGYDYNQVSSWWDFTRVGIKADNNPTESFRLNALGGHWYLTDLQRDVISKSILSPWLKKGITIGSHKVIKNDLNNNPRQNFEDQMSALKSVANNSKQKGAKPQFTFAHVLAPHDPYIFEADGSNPDYDGSRNDSGLDETIKYTNEVTYLNTRIKDTVSYIRQKSPNAAIIIQADEGPYPKQFRFTLSPGHYYDPANLPIPQMKQKFSVLASYYLPGVDSQTTASNVDSSVNTFRYIFNHYLGYDLPNLPVCEFSTGDKYTLYNYQSASKQLTGVLPEACKQYL